MRPQYTSPWVAWKRATYSMRKYTRAQGKGMLQRSAQTQAGNKPFYRHGRTKRFHFKGALWHEHVP